MRWQHCIFDLYGTLVDIRTDEDAPRLWQAMSAYYRKQGAFYRPAELRKAYARAAAHEDHQEIQLELVFQKLFRDRGVDADLPQALQAGRHFRALSTEYIRLYDGAKELLQALRKQGCGVWLLSNAQSMFTMRELDTLGLTPLFDGIYLSSDYGVKKPDRRFFNALLQEHGIAPETAIMIGNDGLCDIQGGKAAGLTTLYIRSNLSPVEPLPDADYVLEQMNLHQAADILLYRTRAAI